MPHQPSAPPATRQSVRGTPWLIRYQRAIYDSGIIGEVGPRGVVLLLAIATEKDRIWPKTEPISWARSTAMIKIGTSRAHTLTKTRALCAKAGALQFTYRGTHAASLYELLIPKCMAKFVSESVTNMETFMSESVTPSCRKAADVVTQSDTLYSSVPKNPEEVPTSAFHLLMKNLHLLGMPFVDQDVDLVRQLYDRFGATVIAREAEKLKAADADFRARALSRHLEQHIRARKRSSENS